MHDFNVEWKDSSSELCGHVLANDGSGSQPISSTAFMIASSWSLLTIMFGLELHSGPTNHFMIGLWFHLDLLINGHA